MYMTPRDSRKGDFYAGFCGFSGSHDSEYGHAFRDTALCSLAEVDRHLRHVYYFHSQRDMSQISHTCVF